MALVQRRYGGCIFIISAANSVWGRQRWKEYKKNKKGPRKILEEGRDNWNTNCYVLVLRLYPPLNTSAIHFHLK